MLPNDKVLITAGGWDTDFWDQLFTVSEPELF